MARKRKYKKRAGSRAYKYRSYQTTPDWLLNMTPDLDPDVIREMIAVLLIGLALFLTLGILGVGGAVGSYVYSGLRVGLGWTGFVLPLVLLGSGIALFYPVQTRFNANTGWGLAGLLIFLAGLLHLLMGGEDPLAVAYAGGGGGMIGHFVSYGLKSLMDFWASLLVLVIGLIVIVLLLFGRSFKQLLNLIQVANLEKELEEQPKSKIKSSVAVEPSSLGKRSLMDRLTGRKPQSNDNKAKTNHLVELGSTEFVPKYIQDENWTPPPIDLLSDETTKVDAGNIEQNVAIIHEALENLGVEVEMAEVNVGPTVTQYTLKPSVGVKLVRITALSPDLALALAAHPIRIEAPIPGRSLVGVEVPNKRSAIVRLREILESPQFNKNNSSLTIPMGRDVAGMPMSANLAQMPHLLIAGATGSGKSVFLNSTLISLLYQNSPTELRLILIDPKRVEFTSYNEVPHLLAPVIVEPNKAVNALKWLIGEMERRYRLFSDFKVRDLESFNKAKGKEMSSLPQIVLVIDELADLMAVSSKEVESYVARLAQMARATGIHLIIATQRPSVDVVTGLIKANFPTRIAFAVTSGTDSRTILDSVGAEKLLGHGDMLYLPRDASKPKRIQGVLVDDREVKSVTKFLKDNRTPSYIDEVTADKKNMGSSQAGGGPDEEPLMEEATEEVVRTGKASTSYLQRKFRIGYARAARLMDLLEEQGVIGAGQGAKPREVLIDREEWLQNQGQAGLNQYTDEETGETYKSGEDY